MCTSTSTTDISSLPVGSTVPFTLNNIPNEAGAAVTIRGDVNDDFGFDADEMATYFDENGNLL
jgi:hypothetical protein